MFKIGDFSRFSRVSVKMLRHYDELGLLVPRHVDPHTNYRYYTADQLPRLNRILALRDLGFSLEQVGEMLDDDLSPEELRGMLKLRRAEIARRLEEEQARLERVAFRLEQIEREEAPPRYDVIVRAVDGQLVAALRQELSPDGESITDLFERLERYVADFGARAPLPPLLIYHDESYEASPRDVEVVLPLKEEIPPGHGVEIRQLAPLPRAACLVHTGRYDTLDHAVSALLGWADAHGYAVAGPLREVYLRFGADNEGYELPPVYLAHGAAEYVTELQLPVGGGRSAPTADPKARVARRPPTTDD
jgi:DNA-binding transcriptional MerR regulator